MLGEGRVLIGFHHAQEFLGGAAGGGRLETLDEISADRFGNEDGVGLGILLVEQNRSWTASNPSLSSAAILFPKITQ